MSSPVLPFTSVQATSATEMRHPGMTAPWIERIAGLGRLDAASLHEALAALVLLAVAGALWLALPTHAAPGDILSLRMCLAASAVFATRLLLRRAR